MDNNRDRDEMYAHRKKWLTKPVRDKRYIRGMVNKMVQDSIRSRDRGDKTTNPEIRRKVLAKTGGTCYLCHRRYDPEKAAYAPDLYFETLQIDHIVPFSKGGPNHIGNYMPACSECNRLKSDLNMGDAKERIRKVRTRRKEKQ